MTRNCMRTRDSKHGYGLSTSRKMVSLYTISTVIQYQHDSKSVYFSPLLSLLWGGKIIAAIPSRGDPKRQLKGAESLAAKLVLLSHFSDEEDC